jgi:hypothetical protein
VPAVHDGPWLRVHPPCAHARMQACRGGSVTARHLASALSAERPPPLLHVRRPKDALMLSVPTPSLSCFLLLKKGAIGTPPPPLLSSPFASATAAPDADALEYPSNTIEQEHRPQAALLPRADCCEESPKLPHVVLHFRRGCLTNGRHLRPLLAPGFSTTRSPMVP